MSPDEVSRNQLVEAGQNIEAQLIELEGMTRGMGDCRAVYAELQKELQDINELLRPHGTDEDPKGSEEDELGYYPLSTISSRTPTKRSRFIAVAILLLLFWGIIEALCTSDIG